MKRVPEPEVMADAEQALAYAAADFAGVNQGFVDGLLKRFPAAARGRIVDLGCGPADIARRLASGTPDAMVVAVDASHAMLRLAPRHPRCALVEARLPELPFADGTFDAVISNSLLHHLPEPAVFWADARRLARPGAVLYVMDLYRPESAERAREIVEAAAGDALPLLKDDFFNSLLAAFTPEEVRAQLETAGLGHVELAVVSERHWLAAGRL